MRNESPTELVERLASSKACNIASLAPQSVVIGSDQVAVFDHRMVGKPGNHQAAIEQLTAFSGHRIEFLTAVSVQCLGSGFSELYVDSTQVCFRALDAAEIERYLLLEKPYDCAGGFKSEALGAALFERIISEDPTALIGLPLIRTAAMLRRAGIPVP